MALQSDGEQMAQTSSVACGWRSPSSVVRVRLNVQPDVGLHSSVVARSALQGTTTTGGRLVEVEHRADLLLLAGTVEWAESSVQRSRQSGDWTPIVVLNVSRENTASARILDAGADDCLVYPFEPAELRSRVHAVMRRQASGVSHDLEIAAATETLRIRVRDVVATVSRKQFEIFVYLAERREHWVHSDEIIAAVSGTHHDPATSLVRVQIHALRKALRAERECIRSDGHRSYMLSLAAT